MSQGGAVLAQNQHADVGRERERLRAALAERQSASVAAAAAPAPDASVDALLEAVSTLLIFTSLFAGVTHLAEALMSPLTCSIGRTSDPCCRWCNRQRVLT